MIDYHSTICPDCHGERSIPHRMYEGALYDEEYYLTYRPCTTCKGTGSVRVGMKRDSYLWAGIGLLMLAIGISLVILFCIPKGE